MTPPDRSAGTTEATTPVEDALDVRLALPALAVWLGAFVGTGGLPGRGSPMSGGQLLALVALGGLSGLLVAVTAAGVRGAKGRPGRVTPAAGWTAGLLLVCIATGVAVGALRLAEVDQSGLAPLVAESATLTATGVLLADPVRHRPKGPAGGSGGFGGGDLYVVRARLDVVEARGRTLRTRAPVLLLARSSAWRRLLPGQRVRLSGQLAAAQGGQAEAAVVSVPGPPVLLGRPPAVQRVAGRLRAGLRDAASVLPAPERGLLPGLVLGDTSRMLPGLVDDFRTAGLTHLTAVSGANLAILATFVLLAARWLGVRGRALPLLGLLAIAGFVVLARPQPSVLRAGVMGAVGLLAMASGRRRQSLPALSAAVVLLVLVDPWLARSYGFVLSALATSALVLLAPRWAQSWKERGMPRAAAEGLAVPLAAQLVCAPVVVLLSGQVSVVAVVANLLAAPAVAPATVLGVLATVVAPVHLGAARILAEVARVPVWWLVQVARRSAMVPGAAISWPSSVTGAFLLTAVTVAAVVGARLLVGRPWLSAGVAVVVATAVVVPTTTPGWPPPGWVLAVCDVGQGDALALSVGPGSAVVIDAGPDPPAVDSCLRGLGVTRVPLLLVTHLHADHVEGFPGVMRGRHVGQVAIGPYDQPAEELAKVRRWTSGADVPVTTVLAGDRMSVGPVSWTVLWPARVIEEESVPNNASLVLLVRSQGLRLLLTGDVEPPSQRAMLARAASEGVDVSDVDVLKVAHHGSSHQDPGLLATARPALGLISVGEGNDYGHPADTTLRALRDAGVLVGRTDRDGTLVVVTGAGGLHLVRSGR